MTEKVFDQVKEMTRLIEAGLAGKGIARVDALQEAINMTRWIGSSLHDLQQETLREITEPLLCTHQNCGNKARYTHSHGSPVCGRHTYGEPVVEIATGERKRGVGRQWSK